MISLMKFDLIAKSGITAFHLRYVEVMVLYELYKEAIIAKERGKK